MDRESVTGDAPSIEREDLQRLVDKTVGDGKSAELIEASVSPLRALYSHAMRTPSSGVAVNPTLGLELPVTRGGRERIAPPAECAKLLAALNHDREVCEHARLHTCSCEIA